MRKFFKSKKNAAEISNVVNGVIEEYRKGSPETDPLGMYTGIAKISDGSVSTGQYAPSSPSSISPEKEVPTQDADDL